MKAFSIKLINNSWWSALTRAGLPVVAHSISFHYTLEARGELVAPQKCWRSVAAWDTVHEGWDGGVTFSLLRKLKEAYL